MGSILKRFGGVAAIVVVTCAASTAAWPQSAAERIEAALHGIATDRPGEVGFATISEGEAYVQCRPTSEGLRCEAAGGLLFLPSPGSGLRAVRLARLAALGWCLDVEAGAFVWQFDPEAASRQIAGLIVDTLEAAYAADVVRLRIDTAWVGAISGLPPYARGETAEGLVALHGRRVEAALANLRGEAGRSRFAVFRGDVGYVQCLATREPAGFYCEVQSASSWPALAKWLTPDRVAWLRRLGYADPGFDLDDAPNHWKLYPAEQWRDATLAAELLTILHTAFDYTGMTRFEIEGPAVLAERAAEPGAQRPLGGDPAEADPAEPVARHEQAAPRDRAP